MKKGYSSSERIGRIVFTMLLSFSMLLSGITPWLGGAQEAYAREITKKNEVQKQGCDNVRAGNPPADYTTVVYKAVFSGGNSYSKSDGNELDQDVTDFAKPLPYGNTYIDVSKLNWNTPSNFIIDIQDDRFQWVNIGGDQLRDKEGHTSTNDPMKLDTPKPLKLKSTTTDPVRGIFYVGPLKSYHEKITDKTDKDGYTNVIKPEGGAPYLYRITYLNAVTLPNGTKGNLVLTMTKVQIETPVTVDEDHPFTPVIAATSNTPEIKADYSYTKAIMLVQKENELGNDTGYGFQDAEGFPLNQQNSVVMTAAKAADRLTVLNSNLPDGDANKIPDAWGETDKYIRNAMGNLLDLDIEVTDAEGNPVNGTIAYAAHDMDFESVQNVWGRTLGDEFSEGMKIVSGAQSYALVPDYAKIVEGQKVFYKDDANAVTRATGWLPVGPGRDDLERALTITKDGDGKFANGVRFASPFLANMRDANGKFDDAIYARGGQLLTYQGDGLTANNNIIVNKYPDAGNNSITYNANSAANGNNDAKKQLYAMLNKADKLPEGVTSWRDITPEMAWEGIGNYYWKAYRNDDNELSFDSGFAVLLDAKKSSIQWSGSRGTGSNLHTKLFDSTLFTYVEPTHGTGGGAYIETYDISTENCETARDEGVVTMGRGADATVTAVPEDGYRVKTIRVGGAGLSDPVVYNIAGLEFTDGIYEDTDNKLKIEDNRDGTYDVILTDVQDPRHVHVDFATDFNFHKVWVGWDDVVKTQDLEMTATPYIYDEETESFVQKGDPVTFTLAKDDAESDSEAHVTEETDPEGNKVWNVSYPSEGYTTGARAEWPALAVEVEPDAHNVDHVERIYWFVTETVPKGFEESYSNDDAEAAGKISKAKARNEVYMEGSDGDLSNWAQVATKDYESVKSAIPEKAEEDQAYMSVFNTEDDFAWGGEIKNEYKPPTPKDDETWGLKGQPQKGRPSFEGGTAEIEKVQFLDEDGNPTDSTTIDAKDADGNVIGTYTLNEDGSVTFTPNADFVGDPVPAMLRGTDALGKSVDAEYKPHVLDSGETDTVKRTIHYIYVDDGEEVAVDVVQEAKFTREAISVDPKTGEIEWGPWKITDNGITDVVSPPDTKRDGTWKPSSDVVTGFPDLTYEDRDQVKDVTVVYSKPPEGGEKKTFGPKGEPQSGTPPFKEGSSPFEKFELVDDQGNPVEELTAYDSDGNDVGTYTIDEATGEVTFTPTDPDFVGTPTPAKVLTTCEDGSTADGLYTPSCIENTEKKTVKKTITHEYEDGSPVLGKDGNPIVTEMELVFEREGKVDPDTGEITWDTWEEQTFDDWDAPDVLGYSPDKKQSKGETVDPNDDDIVDKIVYKKDYYTVTYFDGDHGKSDGKGNQKGVPYGDKVKGGNKVKPDKGYKFTGTYKYVIKDKDGNVIEEGETDDPKSIEVIGNVEFTPVYKKLPTVTYVDPATGRTIMKTTPFLDENTEPDPPKDPKRDGYRFVKWNRFEEYDEEGNLVNVRYEAVWEEVADEETAASGSGKSKSKGTKTGDASLPYLYGSFAVLSAAGLLVLRRRRKTDR